MIGLWFWPLLIGGLIGLALMVGFGRARIISSVTGYEYTISWLEFVIVMAIMAIIVVPITAKVGLNVAKASKLTYHEFWGGYETAALKSTRECHRDGSCHDTYNCDPYEVGVTVTDYDSKGNPSGSHTEYHTEYHDCPVATQENYYEVDTTLGNHDLGWTFDTHPVAWRSSHGLDDTYRGDPPFWLAVKHRLDAGTPGPVTADKTYDNYVLASTKTILHEFSDEVDRYQKLHLLPDPVINLKHPIRDYYYADKMQFVGLHPADRDHWEFALARLNAALGTDLQGDLHVVAIDVNKVTNKDAYTGAVNAYWQDKVLGKRALSKNGIGLVLGVSGDKIVWARAFTGMPVGNSGLTLDLQHNLEGQPFTNAIFGDPVGTIQKDGTATVAHGDSPVEAALWGPNKFHREHMKDFHYLGGEIQPSSGQKHLIEFIAILFILVGWALALFTAIGEKQPVGGSYGR